MTGVQGLPVIVPKPDGAGQDIRSLVVFLALEQMPKEGLFTTGTLSLSCIMGAPFTYEPWLTGRLMRVA
jgi:hypothetical protein